MNKPPEHEKPQDHASYSAFRNHLLNNDDVQSEEQHESWIISYLDLITLLLGILIILGITNSKLETESKNSNITINDKIHALSINATDNNANIEAELARLIGNSALNGIMNVDVSAREIHMQMHASMLFPAGEATLNASANNLLHNLAKLLQQYPGSIEVAGHSDNTPVRGGRFHSNWELSTARAASVVESLITLGIPAIRLHATGYADTRPIEDNRTAEGRAKNRRVEFIIQIRTPPPIDQQAEK